MCVLVQQRVRLEVIFRAQQLVRDKKERKGERVAVNDSRKDNEEKRRERERERERRGAPW